MPLLESNKALQAIHKENRHGMLLSRDTFQTLLLGWSRSKDVASGRQVHSLMIGNGLDSGSFVGDHLIRLFAACGSLLEANIVFCSVERPTVYTWHAIISAHTSFRESEKAIGLFYEMQRDGIQPDKVTFLCILRTCGILGVLEQGKCIHEQVLENGLASDLAIGSTLVDMYAKCGDQEEAHKVFEKLPGRDVVTWNALIAGYLQHGDGVSALKLFERMKKDSMEPDRVTFLCLLKAYAIIKAIDDGYLIHNQIIIMGLDLDVSIGTTLIDMYAKFESLEEARKVFDKSPNRNVVSWNAMIAGYAEKGNDILACEMFEKMKEDGVAPDISSWNVLIARFTQHGDGLSALALFERMQREGVKPDKVSFFCALKACVSVDAIVSGKLIHDQIIRNGFRCDVAIGNTLIDMYAKCGSLEEGRAVFDDLPNRDIVSWNAMLVGYTQHEQGYPALELLKKMQQQGVEPDSFTLSCVLKACGSVGALGQGKLIHGHIFESNLELDLVLASSLVDMYARCGSMEDAQKVFHALQNRDLASWNAMIAGYAQHALVKFALQCLANMKQEGMKPIGRTYTSILAACSHSGDVMEGWHLFKSMKDDHTIKPGIEHFNCMVDLLAHSGHLSEAKEVLHTMPLSPNMTSWLSLLYACRLYSNKELGEECFSQAVRLDSNIAAGYVLMANVYANSHKWEDALKLTELRKCAEARKKPGTAWIEINNKVYEFVVGLEIYPQCENFNVKLKKLRESLKVIGYVPQSGLVLEPVSDQGKEDALYGPCKRPAFAFGLLTTTECTTIRVVTECQSCNCCHKYGKFVPKIQRRTIFLGNMYRFHNF